MPIDMFGGGNDTLLKVYNHSLYGWVISFIHKSPIRCLFTSCYKMHLPHLYCGHDFLLIKVLLVVQFFSSAKSYHWQEGKKIVKYEN
jgi:hypothetical protein